MDWLINLKVKLINLVKQRGVSATKYLVIASNLSLGHLESLKL
jgi:hypothetical protein